MGISDHEKRKFEEIAASMPDVFDGVDVLTPTLEEDPRPRVVVVPPQAEEKVPLHVRPVIGVALLTVLALALVVTLVVRFWPEQAAQPSRLWPPPPADAAAGRILPAVPVTTVGTPRFAAQLPDGRPVTFDPCRPIHYTVNRRGMPPDGEQLLSQALEDISARTGLKFVADPATDEDASAGRAAVQQRYGDRWAPVLITFGPPAADGAEMGGWSKTHSEPVGGPAGTRYVTGQVALDGQLLTTVGAEPALGRTVQVALIQHQLGHLLGLGHADGQNDVMATPVPGLVWEPANAKGLAVLGSGDCHSDS